jgi:hypothetical protein
MSAASVMGVCCSTVRGPMIGAVTTGLCNS